MTRQLLAIAAATAILSAQVQTTPQNPSWQLPSGGNLADAYRTPKIAPVHLNNSGRLETLLRNGTIVLSMQDAIALALENNLDIELVRYAPRLAETDILRAEAGNTLRGIPLAVREGPSGLGTPIPGPDGRLGGGDTPALNSLIGPGVQTDLSILGSLPLSTGPAIPSMDPQLISNIRWDHTSDPQNSAFLVNTRSLNANTTIANVGIQQGFSTGGFFELGWNNFRQNVNNPLLSYNPAISSSFGLTFTQPLLRGFGPAVNRRYIRIAQNNRKVADYVFRQQVIVTVTGIVRLYWDLASLNEDVRVRQDAVTSAEQFLNDNRNQVETGTAAPIDVTRAQAELSRRRRDLSIAKSLVRQEEMVVKDYLTRSRLDSTLANAPITLTDRLTMPAHDPVEPVEDLVQRAMQVRPDIAQARLQITNSEISLEGSKSALRPAVDVIARVANRGLVGTPNPTSIISSGAGNPFIPVSGPPALTGGYGDALSQLFNRDFPDYGIGVQVTIPLRNRTARADVVRDQLTVRQQQIRFQQLEKQVRLEITNALIAVEEARQSYEAAKSERVLQEETLAAEQEKLEVGATTSFYVVQYQRDLTGARSAEISALASYEKAKTALQRAVGTILEDYSVEFEEALQGVVTSPARTRP